MADPVFPFNSGGWNTSQTYDPCIPDPTADPLVLIMSGMGAPTQSGPQRIGRAIASRAAFLSNPVTAWVQDSTNPTMEVGAAGQPDSFYIRQSSCLYNPDDDNKLYEYYTCNNGSADAMCLATSTDSGHTWSKYGVVMSPTIDGCSDETWVSQGAVMRRGTGDWIMVYSWRNPGNNIILPGVRYVTSTDGKHWNRGTCTNSLTVAPQFIEQHQIFMLGGKCVLLYETGNFSTQWTIHSAVAPRCEGPFADGKRNPFIAGTQNPTTNWDAYQVSTPYYFVVNGAGYLFYDGTRDNNSDYNLNHYSLGIAPLITSVAAHHVASRSR